jgi:hypothetical protein
MESRDDDVDDALEEGAPDLTVSWDDVSGGGARGGVAWESFVWETVYRLYRLFIILRKNRQQTPRHHHHDPYRRSS